MKTKKDVGAKMSVGVTPKNGGEWRLPQPSANGKTRGGTGTAFAAENQTATAKGGEGGTKTAESQTFSKEVCQKDK